jgi:aryl-alcohol dehydrogenase-like predicted oxidoreductase
MCDVTEKTIVLNNGVELPGLGLGVLHSEGGEVSAAASTALGAGYRLIDTAAAYFNEREVGQGIRGSRVDHDEVALTTKLWMTDYGFDSALRARTINEHMVACLEGFVPRPFTPGTQCYFETLHRDQGSSSCPMRAASASPCD